MDKVSLIDGPHGIASYLNTITIAFARNANPALFNALVKKKLNLNDISKLDFQQIPLESDAVLFITNPLIIFQVLNDFLRYREQQSDVIYLYITNRVSRWLYRFTQFVFLYDEFYRIVSLTFLHPKRFPPFEKVVFKTIQMLTQEAKESILNQEKPIFLNDLRRLYVIFVRARFLALQTGKQPPKTLQNIIEELVPVISLDPVELKADHIQKELNLYHFTSPKLEQNFLKELNAIQQVEVENLFEFIGFLHPIDQRFFLEKCYQQSKMYLLSLFMHIRKYYEYHQENLPPYYKKLVDIMRYLAPYEEVVRDPNADQTLIAEAYHRETLYIGQFPDAETPEEEWLSDLGITRASAVDWKIPTKDIIFQPFEKNLVAANNQSIFELIRYPFFYVTLEFSKPCFHLLTLGQFFLMNVSKQTYSDLLNYFYGSKQIHVEQEKILHSLQPMIETLVNQWIKRTNFKKMNVEMYDNQKFLKFYDCATTQKELIPFFQTSWQEYLSTWENYQFIVDVLEELQRFLAIEKNIILRELEPQWIPHFLQSERIHDFLHYLQTTPIARTYPKILNRASTHSERFIEYLLQTYESLQKILEYEKVRFTPVTDHKVEKKEKSPTKESKNSFLTLREIRHQLFSVMQNPPKDKQPYLLELARIPFRFIVVEFSKPQQYLFSFADLIGMNIDGDSRKQVLDFLLVTSQLNQQEYNIVKKNMVSLLFFMKPTLEPLQFAKHHCFWSKRSNEFDIHQLRKLVTISDRLIRKNLKPLVLHKHHATQMMNGLSEVERWIAREQNKSPLQLSPSDVLPLLENNTRLQEVYEYLMTTAFGRQYFAKVRNHPKSLEAFRQQLIEEYKLNVRLIAYYEQHH